MMKNIALFVADSNGCYPVPASKGGAVSTLVELLVEGNNRKQLVDMTLVSYFDKKAFELSKRYPNVHFIWIKVPWIVKLMDKILFSMVSKFSNLKATSFKSLVSLLYYTFKSSRIIKKLNFDAVVLEHNIPQVWMIKWSGYNGKYFHHLHNLPRTNAKCMDALNKCTKFLCISQYMVNDITSEDSPIGPVSLERTKILFNCIDTSLFRPIEREKVKVNKADYGIDVDSRVLLFAGRITWEKGIDKVLEAFDYIKHNHVELLVAGDMAMALQEKSPYADKLIKLGEKYQGRIHFTGYVEHDKLPELYNLADIAVLPSMWEEPAGLTMVEAMACGTPVITTKSGGIPEYVADAGIVLERNENLSREIASSIDLLLEDRDLYQTLRNKGIERVRKNFDSSDYIDKFCEAIK